MTAAVSPFSFHCMICFEEFHTESRYPVILPCGHTYVCHVCSERLDKCMECRTPLFVWTVPQPKPLTVPANNNNPNHSRYHHPRGSAQQTHRNVPRLAPSLEPPTKTRLPLPKNVVLLSLMEATELTTERQKPASPKIASSLSKHQQEEEEEEEEVNLEETKIREGTSLAVSGCGTYGVTAESLLIYPIRPSAGDTAQADGGDVDTLVRFHHLDQEVDKQRVSMGDRIQIVSIDGGWAKLARGYGFIQANSNQIVKVGGAMDRACVLEAMLHSLSIRRKELRKQQSKVDSRFVFAMNELQTSLAQDEDLTVICAETFKKTTTEETKPEEKDESEAVDKLREMKMCSSLMDEDDDDDDSDSDSSNDDEAENEGVPAPQEQLDMPNLAAPVTLTRQETPQCIIGPTSSGLGCGFSSSLLPEMTTTTTSPTNRARAASHPTEVSPSQFNQSQMSAGARAWRERHNRPASKGIDFRTGLSGHTALMSSHAHPHGYLGRSAWRTGMSNHSGLSRTVRKAPSFPPDCDL